MEIRLISALTKEEAEQEKQNVQFSAEKALADEEIQMEKVEQESERLKMEAAKNSEVNCYYFFNGRFHTKYGT